MGDFWTQVILPVFTGTFGIAGGQVTKRMMLKGGRISPFQFCILGYGSATVLYAIIHVLFWGVKAPQTLDKFWNGVLLAMFANLILQALAAQVASLEKGEISLTGPISAMTPGLITILALLLGEYPGRVGFLGIWCMMTGSWILLFKKKPTHWTEYFGPIVKLTLLFRWSNLSEEEQKIAKVVRLSVLQSVCGTFGLLGESLFVRRGGGFHGMLVGAMAVSGIMCVLYVMRYAWKPDSSDSIWQVFSHRPDVPPGGKFSRLPNMAMLAFVYGTMWVLNMLAVLTAFGHTFVAHVGALKRLSIPLSSFLGFWLFQEQDIKQRMWATAIIIVGAILISFDGLPARLSERVIGLGF